MTVYLPDTNILIDCFRSRRGRRELLARLVSGGNMLGFALTRLLDGVDATDLVPTEIRFSEGNLFVRVGENVRHAVSLGPGLFVYIHQGRRIHTAPCSFSGPCWLFERQNHEILQSKACSFAYCPAESNVHEMRITHREVQSFDLPDR